MALATVYSPEEWLQQFGGSGKRAVVTIGNFDGVHRGHQKILQSVVERARRTGAMATVLTFFPHPARVLKPEQTPCLLSTLDQRLAAFDAAGIDAALVVRFDINLVETSAENFAKNFLIDTLRAETVLVGADFRFGHRQAGDVKLLEELGRRSGYEVEIVQPVIEDGAVISSSAIRQALRDGRVEDARRMLGRPYALQGEIRTGTGQGRKLVVPTLNLATEQEMLPKTGVYATEVVVGGQIYGAATNVGMRPTFDGTRITIESYLFDFGENVTSGKMEVRFLARLRDEQKFSGPDTLKVQVLRDIESAQGFYKLHTNQSPSLKC
jgi:riboflavin kinase / FMN adenylyltransferase